MSLENTQSSVTVTGNGTTTSIPVYFPVMDAAHLVLSGYKADKTPFTFVMGTNYNVALNPAATGGAATATITLTTPLATGWTLTVERNVPLVQTSVFDNQAGLQPKAVENRLDYLTMIAQQLDREMLARLEIPPGMTAAQIEQLLVNNAATLASLQAQVNAKASAADLAAAIASLALKANIDSPTLTGAPKASTPADNDNSTRIANTAWVKGQNYAPLESPAFTGNPTAPTQPVGNNSERVANTAFVAAGLATRAKNALATQESDGLMSAEDKRKLDQYAGGEIDVGTIDGLEEALDKKADKTALAAEVTARQNADATLQTQVNNKANTSDLSALATKTELTAETTARQSADTSLQTQIDAKAGTATATPSANGLMSAADKTKLDGLDPSGGSGLPEGGGANDILAKDASNAAGWKTPAQVAETLPKASAAAYGVAKADGVSIVASNGVLSAVGGGGGEGTSDHRQLSHRNDPEQHLAIAVNVGTEASPVGLDVKLAAMEADLAAETAARETDVAAVQGQIAAETTARTSADDDLQTRITANATAIADETTARTGGDNALQYQISNETDARTTADANLQSQIDALGQGGGGTTVHNELDGRDAADSHPQSAITGLTSALAAKADTATVNSALALKANLASPALTGTPTVPTAAAGTNTTQAASTQFVQTAVSGALKRVTGTLSSRTSASAREWKSPKARRMTKCWPSSRNGKLGRRRK